MKTNNKRRRKRETSFSQTQKAAIENFIANFIPFAAACLPLLVMSFHFPSRHSLFKHFSCDIIFIFKME